jgi:hypothetical protein
MEWEETKQAYRWWWLIKWRGHIFVGKRREQSFEKEKRGEKFPFAI